MSEKQTRTETVGINDLVIVVPAALLPTEAAGTPKRADMRNPFDAVPSAKTKLMYIYSNNRDRSGFRLSWGMDQFLKASSAAGNKAADTLGNVRKLLAVCEAATGNEAVEYAAALAASAKPLIGVPVLANKLDGLADKPTELVGQVRRWIEAGVIA